MRLATKSSSRHWLILAGVLLPLGLLGLRLEARGGDSSVSAAQGDGSGRQEPARRTEIISALLDKPMEMPFGNPTPLADVLNYIQVASQCPELPDGIPIYVDIVALREAERRGPTRVRLVGGDMRLGASLTKILEQIGLRYTVESGLLLVEDEKSAKRR